MSKAEQAQAQAQGVGIQVPANLGADVFQRELTVFQSHFGFPAPSPVLWTSDKDGHRWTARLDPAVFARLCPGFDTLALAQRLADWPGLETGDSLLREVWLALLCAPQRIDFDSLSDLESHIRARCHIARAAEKTALAFKTSDAAERPQAFWHYEEDVGFLLQPQADLIDALMAATQPERTGRLYDFSCYRASEYVILLGLAQEARASSPQVYQRLQATARQRCIKSGLFHEVFLIEYGSVDLPIPARYYVPGDRVWFKNPDEVSSNADGYEGSWVIYMGGGLFSNFWKRDRPFTLDHKALEVFHWRHGLYFDEAGEPQINEHIVEARVAATQADAVQSAQVLARMSRYRDPSGVYQAGGCIDSSREFPRPLARISLD
jgi:hypothetical protein